MMASAPLSGRLASRYGPRIQLLTGLGTITIGYALAFCFAMSGVWALLLIGCLNGIGVGLAFAALPALIMSAVPVSQSAAGNGLNSLTRSVGTSTASAVTAAILTSLTITVAGRMFPSERAFHLAFLLGASAGFIGFVLTIFIPGHRASKPGTTEG